MLNNNIKTRVGIIRGGVGKHYEHSLQKGGDIISHIFEKLSHKYKIVDILIDKNNVWHANGVPINPSDLLDKIDVAWNTLYNFNVSPILNNLAIPNIGNEYFLGALKNNKDTLREHIKSLGIKMPRSIVSPKNAREVFEKFSSPWIVKINNEIKLVKTFNELAEIIKDRTNVIVEEFILGKVTSLHSVSGFRGEDVYVFPARNAESYADAGGPPLNFSISEKEKISSIVKDLHIHLGVNHYLKSDFILHPKMGFFLTSVDFSPDLRAGSHFEQSCKYVGADIHHIIEHILERALNR